MTPLDWVTLGASTTLVAYATLFASSRAVVTRQAAWALAPWPPLVRLVLLVHGLVSITFVAQAIVIVVQVHMHHHAWTPRLIYPIIASFAAWTIVLWAAIDDMYKFAKLHWTAYTFWVLAAAAETAIVWADTLQGDSQATLFLVSEGIGITRVALVWSLLMLALIQVGQASESTHEERAPLVRHANNNSNPIPVTTTTPSPSSFAPFSSSIVSLYHTLRPLCPTLWPQQPSMQVRLVLAYLCLLVGLAVTALAPLQVGLIIDAVANDQLGWAGILICAGILVVKGTLYFVDKVRLWLLRPVQGVMMRDMWMRCFEQVHAMSLSFLGDRCTADVLRTLDRGTKGAMHVLSYLVFHVAPAIFDTLLASAVFAVLFGPIAGLIALATIIIYAYTAVNILQWHAKCTWRDITIDPSPYGNHENDHERHMAIDQLRNLNDTPSVASYALHLLQHTILCFTIFTTSLLLAWQFALGNISLGAIATLLLYAVVLYRPVQWFALYYPQYKASLMDMQLMVDLLQNDVDVKDQPDASELHAYTGDIAFDHVSYAYKTQGEGAWALKDVSFSIEGGSKVAVIGAAGAGKTTLVRLLFRLMDPLHGVIRVDGRDLRNVTQSSLRSHLGVVPHDPLLITDATLRSNLLLGLKVTDAEMKHVMELVDLHVWAMALPNQFDTKITNIAISNEQKHRIALARALLNSPAILVLDETTSSLDAATDASLKKAKANAMRGKTTLILVHQLPSTMEVDTILE
ncbi:hypothetical protein BC940DRAFT_238091 [Gongronella butleri]|nr:hypothetical protein BC940DRAFT_238091 [Gongronella butleri]